MNDDVPGWIYFCGRFRFELFLTPNLSDSMCVYAWHVVPHSAAKEIRVTWRNLCAEPHILKIHTVTQCDLKMHRRRQIRHPYTLTYSRAYTTHEESRWAEERTGLQLEAMQKMMIVMIMITLSVIKIWLKCSRQSFHSYISSVATALRLNLFVVLKLSLRVRAPYLGS